MEDTSVLMPRELHRPMAVLGKHPWFNFAREADGTVGKINTSLLARVRKEQPIAGRAVDCIHTLHRLGDSLGLAEFEGLCKLFADGPKLFEPTEEQFESMTHVDMHIMPADFRSPFPALVVRIPNGVRKQLADKHHIDIARAPRYVSVRTRMGEGDHVPVVIVVGMRFHEYNVTYLIAGENGLDMEQSFQKTVYSPLDKVYGKREEELEFTAAVTRAALNFCLMMTHFGCKVVGPADRRRYEINQRPGREQFKHSDYFAIQMTQKVVVRERLAGSSAASGASGWEVKPHWRRGHWRKLEVKLVFVRPCLVRKDRILGDVSDSDATYSAK